MGVVDLTVAELPDAHVTSLQVAIRQQDDGRGHQHVSVQLQPLELCLSELGLLASIPPMM